MHVTRLRQVVVAAGDCDKTVRQLQETFGLGAAFADPGVGEFGLVNGVLPVGDQFVEVVSPAREGTTAGRWMTRGGGDRGYMVIVQVDSIDSARAHINELGLRTVWSADLPEVSGTHIHPADIGGAIVSVDQPQPPDSWLWGGPNWRSEVRTENVRGVAGITMASPDPESLCASWSRAFRIVANAGVLALPDGSTIAFVGVDDPIADGREGLVAIDLHASSRSNAGTVTKIAGTSFRTV